ncbi:hypothetical protein [Longimicrobium sp.]|uniref:hypothetical protein n=1 Tax=Longimicrobium sp. TaxID=2029185 RepID=UPI003B3AC5A0
MKRFLRLLLCVPLLAATACAADGIAGPALSPVPEADIAAPAGSEITYQGCVVPSERVAGEPLYIVDGVILESRPELDAIDIESIVVRKDMGVSGQNGARVLDVIIITTTRGATRRGRGTRQ